MECHALKLPVGGILSPTNQCMPTFREATPSNKRKIPAETPFHDKLDGIGGLLSSDKGCIFLALFFFFCFSLTDSLSESLSVFSC